MVIHGARLLRRRRAARRPEENGRFNYKANGFMCANAVRVSRRDADLITAAAPAARARH